MSKKEKCYIFDCSVTEIGQMCVYAKSKSEAKRKALQSDYYDIIGLDHEETKVNLASCREDEDYNPEEA